MQDHRQLRVWQKAKRLALWLRRATRHFPRSGYGTLQSQMIRAVESIVSNIAEGCGASSRRDFAKYLDVGIKSSSEADAQLELARDYGALSDRTWHRLRTEVVDVRRMLCGLRSKVLAGDTPSPRGANKGRPVGADTTPVVGDPRTTGDGKRTTD